MIRRKGGIGPTLVATGILQWSVVQNIQAAHIMQSSGSQSGVILGRTLCESFKDLRVFIQCLEYIVVSLGSLCIPGNQGVSSLGLLCHTLAPSLARQVFVLRGAPGAELVEAADFQVPHTLTILIRGLRMAEIIQNRRVNYNCSM